MKHILTALALLMALLLALPDAAPAQTAGVAFGSLRDNSREPVEVSAESLSVDQATGTAVFSGNVVIGQGTLRLAAPRVRIVYHSEGGRIARLEATGGVTLVDGDDSAEADRADYDLDKGRIVLVGNVLVSRGPNAIAADRMEVDLTTGRATVTGRVRTVIVPRSTEGAD